MRTNFIKKKEIDTSGVCKLRAFVDTGKWRHINKNVSPFVPKPFSLQKNLAAYFGQHNFCVTWKNRVYFLDNKISEFQSFIPFQESHHTVNFGQLITIFCFNRKNADYFGNRNICPQNFCFCHGKTRCLFWRSEYFCFHTVSLDIAFNYDYFEKRNIYLPNFYSLERKPCFVVWAVVNFCVHQGNYTVHFEDRNIFAPHFCSLQGKPRCLFLTTKSVPSTCFLPMNRMLTILENEISSHR